MELCLENLKQDNGFWMMGTSRWTSLKNDRDKKLEESQKLDKELGRLHPRAIEARGKSDEADKAFIEFDKLLTSGEAFIDQSVQDFEFTPGEMPFSLGDTNGRFFIDKSTIRIVMPKDYSNTECAEIVSEGTAGSEKPLSLTVIKTDSVDSIKLEDIRAIDETIYEDDTDNILSAFEYNHKVAFINAENKKAFSLLLNAKDALTLSVENMQKTINANLCSKAKKKAVIVTNKSGFAKLDIDANGTPLVTKDSEGSFIFKSKYKIVEMADEILPNTEAGESPVIIGDLSIVQFLLQREDYSEKEDLEFNQLNRGIRKEIVTLSTTSDDAYIHGLLA